MNEWIKIGMKMLNDFNNAKDQTEYFKCLAVLSVPKQNILLCHNILVRSGKIPLIENLPLVDREKMWEMAKELADGRLKTIEEMKNFCRCLLTFEYLMSL